MDSQEEKIMSNDERPPPYEEPMVQTGNPIDGINMNPVNNVMDVINMLQLDSQPCVHPNLMLSYTYDFWLSNLIMMISVLYFPLGLCSLIASANAKNYTCPICGYKQASGPRICLYVTFGVLVVAAITCYGVLYLPYIGITNPVGAKLMKIIDGLGLLNRIGVKESIILYVLFCVYLP